MLIWKDEENFARRDRVGALQDDQIQYTCDFLIVKDGAQVFHASKALTKVAVRRRLERSGNRLRASVTQDGGQTWTSFRSQEVALPTDIKVGIAAHNNTVKPLIAEFQGFTRVNKQ